MTARMAAPWTDFAFLAVAGALILRPLAAFWSSQTDYAFGWSVPFLAAYLFFERWRDRPARQPAPAKTAVFFLLPWAAALLAGRMLEEVVPDWRPVLWLEASLYVGAVLAWCGLYGGRAWLGHFAFPVGFLLLAVPWLYNLEQPIVQGLMRVNAVLVAGSLLLADIPARAAGNTLFLSTGQLGIEEACSGIRSLQAVLMMSLFLGEFYRFPLRRRLLLPVLGVLLALAGNYARLLFLAWDGARRGISSVEAVHDPAGAAILAFTVAGLWIACLFLRPGKKFGLIQPFDPDGPPAPAATCWAAGLLVCALAAEGATQGWFAWREAQAARAVAWDFRWPEQIQGVRPIPLAPATRGLLRYDRARTGSWRDGRGWQWQALWFAYGPEAPNRIASDLHNPEVCLTAAGLRKTQDYGEFACPGRGIVLPVHAYLFTSGPSAVYVFWVAHRDRGRGELLETVYGQDAAAFRDRLAAWSRDAWRGWRGAGSQTLEVTVSGPADYGEARRAFAVFAQAAVGTDEAPRSH